MPEATHEYQGWNGYHITLWPDQELGPTVTRPAWSLREALNEEYEDHWAGTSKVGDIVSENIVSTESGEEHGYLQLEEGYPVTRLIGKKVGNNPDETSEWWHAQE